MRRAAWCLPFCALLASCASGISARIPPETTALKAAPEQAEPWSRLAEVEAWTPLNTIPFPSRGHLTSPSYATVRVSPNARDAYAALVTDTRLPDAAVVALFHHDREGSERGRIFVMEKAGTAWRFQAFDARGRPEVPTETCARCHAFGIADQLFGLPSSTAPAPQPPP